MAAISPEAPMELEVMRKDDGSWHPCRISLSDDGSGIKVCYESCDEEYIISNREDALGHLRFRSVPLQEGDCLHIEEGHHVLAMHKAQSRTLFFDAVIEKPYRVKHSKRVYCRCKFEIKWLNLELKGETMTVPSSSIMKLSEKCITNDSVVGSYLSSLIRTNRLEDNPPLCSLWEENEPDIDIYGLVQKIEETCLLGAEGDKPGIDAQSQNVRRSTRSLNKQEVKRKQKIQEDKLQLESKSFLSPLAHRAALASFMHEREWKDNGDLSFNNLKEKIKENSSRVGGILLKSDTSSHVDDLDPVQNADIDSPVEARQLFVSSASNRRNSRKKFQPKSSPVLLTMLEASASSKLPGTKQVSSSTMEHMIHLVADEKLNGHDTATRKTRSAPQKENLKSTAEMTQMLSNERNNHQISTRLTCSAKSKEMNSPNSVLGLGKNNLIHTIEGSKHAELEGEICSTAIMERIRNTEQGEKLNDNTLTSRNTRSAEQRKALDSVADESSKRQMSTRLTRSARNKEVDCSRIILGPRKSKLAETSQREEMETELCSSSTIDKVRNSLTDGKLNGYAITPRMTRSAAQRDIAESTAEVFKVSLDDKQHGPVNTTRFTRSARKTELDNSNCKQELGNILLAAGLNCHESKGEAESPTIMKHVKNPAEASQCEQMEAELCSSSTIEKVRNSLTDGKLNGYAITPRMTRSAAQRDIADSTAEVSKVSLDDKQHGPVNATRFTRSARKKELDNLNGKQELGSILLAEGLNCNESKGEPESPTILKHVKNPVMNGKSNDRAVASRMTRSTMQRELRVALKSTPEVSHGPSEANKNGPMNTSWLTCSEKKVSSVVCAKQAFGNRELTKDSQDASIDYLGSPQKSESKKKKFSLPIRSDTESMSNKKKRARTTDADPNAEDDRGKISENDSTPVANRKVVSSKKSELRFSPRLRLLP